jgi:GTP-binding protein EngB required for normal cell division
MDKQQNDFMLMRHVVSNVVSQYKELRKCIGWKDSGKSATILRLANPFLTGYFTIAVAGKMSAGKSTFINSLIGENLLPTGHFSNDQLYNMGYLIRKTLYGSNFRGW